MIQVFVGCSANNEDLESQVVFKYQLERLASAPVNITWMRLSRDPSSPFYSADNAGWVTNAWATPFSAFRWAIPSVMGYTGRAIYFDSDFIPMADVKELADLALHPGRVMVAKGGNRYCCTLWDCAAAVGHVPHYSVLMRDPNSHARMNAYFGRNNQFVQTFSPLADWNVMDLVLPVDLTQSKIKAIHYTQLHKQLHYKYAIPRLQAEGVKHWYQGGRQAHDRTDLQALFDRCYEEAVAAGITPESLRVEPFGAYRIRGK